MGKVVRLILLVSVLATLAIATPSVAGACDYVPPGGMPCG